MDFYQIVVEQSKKRRLIVKPDFLMGRSKDFMVRGNSFYAIWDEDRKMWSTDEFDVIRLIEKDLREYAQTVDNSTPDGPMPVTIESLRNASSKVWIDYNNFLRNMPDTNVQLDNRIIFADEETSRTDYASKRLPYALSDAPCPAYEELMSTLYDPEERDKLEWAIGSIFVGDARKIQKFIVLYGEAGSGKSTFLNILQALFEGYYTTFEAKALVGANNAFSTDAFRTNPLVAIQHDGDLSRIEDNSKLNSIVSHEEMMLNEKYKPSYTSKMNAFLFMGTNRPVKITDAKSGLIRRLIDVHPSGRTIPPERYYKLTEQVLFELGSIAKHCIDLYKELGKNYYNLYTPDEMIEQTDAFYNFVLENYFEFKNEDGVSLKRAWALYKDYFEKAALRYDVPMYRFRQELKNYFKDFYAVTYVDGKQVRSYYSGFLTDKFKDMERYEGQRQTVAENHPDPEIPAFLDLKEGEESIFDRLAADYPAQYATSNSIPLTSWDKATTTLKDLDTSKLHYVKVPMNHIVIDFDLKDTNGNKSLKENIAAASKWPETYAEVSKGGNGLHLHYIYDGDPAVLSRVYDADIEVKVFNGNSSLRRKLTAHNSFDVAHISSGLPLKGDKPMVNFDAVLSEKKIRELILRNLNKEIHGYTAPSIDFIYHILEEQYAKGAKYDVTDLRPRILTFANESTHQASKCLALVAKMKFKSDEPSESKPVCAPDDESDLVFFDCEVFPNLFLVSYKPAGKEKHVINMINPAPEDMEELMHLKLVGFNCRRYDNHIIYARFMGYTNEQLYILSQRIVADKKDREENRNCFFSEAYSLSYTDVYDFASAGNKKSLKKFEIELGIHHKELGIPWDKPVPEDRWMEVAEYCGNDVIATEAVFDHLKGDWVARQILAELSGLTVNDTTNQHSARIIFGRNRHPQNAFNYRDLAEPVKRINDDVRDFLKENTPLPLTFTSYDKRESDSILPYFPGYKFENGVSTYRDEVAGEGGYVYSEPGIHYNVALLDVASMHPSTAEAECLFGVEYMQVFSDIKKARVMFKHSDFTGVESILDGKLVIFADKVKDGIYSAKDISNALKTVINSVYGLTAAKFENPFRDPRNVDNIMAKRGALFMIDLKHAIQERGFTVAHIKTDSIKIPNATPEIIDFVMEFGKMYGYTFEHEATYEKMCLVDKANYVAKHATDEYCKDAYNGFCPEKNAKSPGKWTATGDNFAHPYIFKTMFAREPIIFEDLREVKAVQKGALYLDMNEDLPEDEHELVFVGRVGAFTPIKPGRGGGVLYRINEGKQYAAAGSTGYRWLETEFVKEVGKEKDVDMSYYRSLVDGAVKQISEYGDVEAFIADDSPEAVTEPFTVLPWCEESDCASCADRDDCHSLAASYISSIK